MSDTISRQSAIDGLRDYLVGKRCPDDGTLTCRLIENEVVNKLPSALSTNLAEVGTDCISRQAAIDAISEYGNGSTLWMNVSELARRIKQLPPIHPEIVRCKDCRYYNSEEKECLDLMGHGRRWEEDDFCSYADMREVTT